jgi:hypothetical protein
MRAAHASASTSACSSSARKRARIAIDSPRPHPLDPAERVERPQLATHHARQVLVGEHRVWWNAFGLGEALEQFAQLREDGKIDFAERL